MQARSIRRGPSSSSLSVCPQGGRQTPLTMKKQPTIADLNTSFWVGSHRYRKILPEGVTECTNTLKASAKLGIECYPGNWC